MIRNLFLIALGGGVGSMLRYLTTVYIQKYFSSVFPLATLVANIVGCLLIGIIIGLLGKNHLADSTMKALLVTGFCGGYTTFSTFGYENISMLQQHNFGWSFVYIASSVIVGLFAVWLGLTIVK